MMKANLNIKHIVAVIVSLGFFGLYPLAYQAIGIQANTLTVIPITTIA